MANVVSLTQKFIVSAHVLTEQIPTHTQALTQMLVEHIGRPMAADLRADGYEVGELEHIISGSLITHKDQGDRTLLLCQFPRPIGPDPEATFWTVRVTTAELVGGAWDGTRCEPTTQQRDTYTHYGTEYHRAGYHLPDGVWMYQLARATADTEEPA